MKLLVLGGTIFLGRHLVDAALARGHEVTLFNRGRSNPELFPDVEKLHGDRDGGLDALRGRAWDAVIDTCGYVPRIVRASAELLADSVGHYTFISSISVYADFRTRGIDEMAPIGTLDDPATEEVTGETYGPLKALCEQAAEEAMPGRVLNIRPGLIVGPHDLSERFTYWVRRIARGGDVLAPGPPEGLVQFIDARDLAEWTLNMIESCHVGVYNATGPDYPLTMGRLLGACREVIGSDARLIWVNGKFLLERGVKPWSDLPVWVPQDDPAYAGFASINCSKAIKSGLAFRPLEETIRDTLAWANEHSASSKSGPALPALPPEREAEMLRVWKQFH
ncbi:MAG TPA: SDR family oxidoreductase [Chthonomonadales bacterium]|nr:SDR family oxidoreductase [Chthonomonadales bacterium]